MVPKVEGLPLLTEILDPVAIEPDRLELLRYVGYPRKAAQQRAIPEVVERNLELGLTYLHPKAMYSIYRVERHAPQELGLGTVTIRGKVASFLAAADRIAIFVATVGRKITDASQAASRGGDPVTGWVFDALGSYAAEATADVLSRHLRNQFPLARAVSERFSPGYCGIQLSEQSALFGLIDAATISITLQPTMLMQPTKSISGLLGIGSEGAFPTDAMPCQRCKDVTCPMRRNTIAD